MIGLFVSKKEKKNQSKHNYHPIPIFIGLDMFPLNQFLLFLNGTF